MGSAFLDASKSLSEYLRAAKEAPFATFQQVYQIFTQEGSPCESHAGQYLSASLSVATPLNTGLDELYKILSSTTAKIDPSLFNGFFESADRLSVHSSGNEQSSWFSAV
jgi:hypothetical protein